MKKHKLLKTIIFTIVLLLVAVGSVLIIIPTFNNTKFGLDLQGGFEILYQVESIDGKKITKDMVNSTYKTIRRRIDVLGVSEPEISIEGDDRIRVKLAGVSNKEEAKNLISTTAVLTFRDAKDKLLMTSSVLSKGGAKVSKDSNGYPAVALSIADKDLFYDVTSKVSNMNDNVIVIWLDFDSLTNSYIQDRASCGSLSSSNCLSAATVSQGFASDVIIQGNFTTEEATNLVELINSGSLPTKLVQLSSNTVDASFGMSSLKQTATAGVIGIALIILLMCVIYRFAGFLSGVSIIIYTLLVFLTNYLIGGVLTLPGIAAVVLGIGMAIDSNVIMFERIKDELYSGKDLKKAFDIGQKQSFASILDANVTTFIIAVILFIFGESSIKGFATMLIVSLIVTMLVMVFLTRFLMIIFVKTGFFENKFTFFVGLRKKIINKKRNKVFDFFKPFKLAVIIPIIIFIISGILLGVKGVNLSSDYLGGTAITLTSDKVLKVDDIKKDVISMKYDIYDITSISDGNGVYLKIDNQLNESEQDKLKNYFKDKYDVSIELGVVNNQVKKDLTKNAIYSLIFSMLGMIVYVTIRYRFNYAVSAIITLAHDALMMVSMFVIFRLEVSTMFIAAVLAIIGYSINDTIVSFDRIRFNIKQLKNGVTNKEELKEVVNLSINQTYFRSLVTTITTLLPVIALMIFGSYKIINFNIAMFIGLIAGTYSSVFIACQLFYKLEQRKMNGKKKKKSSWFDLSDEPEEKLIKGINS